MPKRKAGLYPPEIQELIAEKSLALSKAQAFAGLGMADMARDLWVAAGEREERLAPLLEALGHDLEAAAHRISAAGCYQRAGVFGAAINLYQAALAGPLREQTRADVKKQLGDCLGEISREAFPSASRRREGSKAKA
ncbi:MAG: hypothetical protein U0793_14725 [Gemmataceae bacterium]